MAHKRLPYAALANSLLLSNVLANLSGIIVIILLGLYFQFYLKETLPFWAGSQSLDSDLLVSLITDAIALIASLIYERPFRAALKKILAGQSSPPGLAKARRRLLNYPFFAVTLDMLLWTLTGLFSAMTLWIRGYGPTAVTTAVISSLVVGAISSLTAFAGIEYVRRRHLISLFFPKGGLSRVKGVFRIKIWTRIGALVVGLYFLPAGLILLTVRQSAGLVRIGLPPAESLEMLSNLLYLELAAFALLAVRFAWLVSSNLSQPLEQIIATVRRIRRGVYDQLTPVGADDEIGFTGEAINEMAVGLAEREKLRETFGKYVSAEVRDEILSGRLPLDGEVKEVTVLFADLRNFTPLAESNDPKQVVRLINLYFKEMEAAVSSRGGLVLQFIGDEIEAVFGAPLDLADHPRRAVEAALDMRSRLTRLNERLLNQNLPGLSHGIGVHTGPAVAANIGSPDRLSYALVGDTVNTASRIQGLTGEMNRDILISRSTADLIGDGFELEPLAPVPDEGQAAAHGGFGGDRPKESAVGLTVDQASITFPTTLNISAREKGLGR